MRFSYNSENIKPSNISTNEITNTAKEYFTFVNEFDGALEMVNLSYDGEGDGIRAYVSFKPPITESDHIMQTGVSTGRVVNTQDGVLLGKMSFQMLADELDVENWFKLEESGTAAPKTGIMINIDGINSYYYDAQSTFKFTDNTASKDANLSNLIVSSGVEDIDPDKNTYKEYDLDPTFNKEHLEYELTLMEYIDSLDITVNRSNQKSSMKIRVPQRDENNELQYESDGTTIIYEEKEISDNVPLEVTLNKLGEPDTLVEIIVTAEDEKTTNTYKVTIHRPYGTIKGSVVTSNTNDIHKAYIKTYYSSIGFDWEDMSDHDELDLLKLETMVESEDDGSYELFVVPGTYDLILDKPGYLDYIILGITIGEGDEIDLDEIELMAGDVNKDGIVELEDMAYINNNYDSQLGDGIYEERFDFTGDELVDLEDMSLINNNYDIERTIINY